MGWKVPTKEPGICAGASAQGEKENLEDLEDSYSPTLSDDS